MVIMAIIVHTLTEKNLAKHSGEAGSNNKAKPG